MRPPTALACALVLATVTGDVPRSELCDACGPGTEAEPCYTTYCRDDGTIHPVALYMGCRRAASFRCGNSSSSYSDSMSGSASEISAQKSGTIALSFVSA